MRRVVRRKKCSYCDQLKNIEEFHTSKANKDGHQSRCKTCSCQVQREWIANNKDKNRDRIREHDRGKGLGKYLLREARRRARENGLEFSVTSEELIIPEKCPVLGITLKVNDRVHGRDSFTLDRIDSSEGYIPGNVTIISHLANRMKSDATPEELLMFADWVYKTYGTNL